MGRLPSYRDFAPLLGTMRLPGIPYSPSFKLSRQKNPQPADSVRRSEKKRPSEGSRRMALSGPKTFARPEYVPLWNSELNVWRSGLAGFLSPLAKSHGYNISKGSAMTQRATTSLSLHYQVKPSQKERLLVEIKGMLDRCAKEPEFIMGILHETPERPNQFALYELWKGTRAEFDATQGTKPYRKAYIENTKKFLEKVDVEWNLPILEWGTNLTGLNQS